jgi:molybdopterin-guanine dinucleotide biosynthesis protein A
MKRTSLLGTVLAGGASRRLGRDKAAERVGAHRLVDRAISALQPHCGDVVLVSSRPDTPAGGWRVVADLRPSCGPLGGIEAALAAASAGGHAAAFVLAVDLPLIEAPALLPLVARFEAGSGPVAAGREGDPDFQPLCAIYPVECGPAVTRLLDQGARAARALFETVGGARVDLGLAELNVNDEADLLRAEIALRKGAGLP